MQMRREYRVHLLHAGRMNATMTKLVLLLEQSTTKDD